MRYLIYIAVLSAGLAKAQSALYNTGNLRIHPQGEMGFHTDLINNGIFDDNQGLAGFYGFTSVSVSGAFVPVFFDAEIANDGGVDLLTSVQVSNNTNFVVGDFRTPRAQTGIAYSFFGDAFYVGEGDPAKVDGYAAISDIQEFTFPVGGAAQYRPLTLSSSGINSFAQCAYFLENPSAAGFNIRLKPRDVAEVSTVEYWKLEGSVSSTITVSWNARSNMASIAPDPNSVTLLGWSKSEQRWVSIGATAVAGDLTMGLITSASFVPDNYDAITFGSNAEPLDFLFLDNYLITPNGDGINDFLEIPELSESPNNQLRIYNRQGLKVFEAVNYVDGFRGYSNVDNLVINREQGLPEGVYFYIIRMEDLDLDYQGFLYLDRAE